MKPNELTLSGTDLSGFLEEVVSRKADFRFRANGSSMAPFIKDSDIITLAPLSRSAPGVGKVAAFCLGPAKRLVVHRIVAKSARSYFLKGDGCRRIDGLIRVENILGVALKLERQGRAIRWGLGPERFIIAFLSRNNFLPFIFRFWQLLPLSARKFIKCRIRL